MDAGGMTEKSESSNQVKSESHLSSQVKMESQSQAACGAADCDPAFLGIKIKQQVGLQLCLYIYLFSCRMEQSPISESKGTHH